MIMEMSVIDYLAKWAHVLAGITWIGLLYYFNFVQTEYFKEADADARTDAFTKLAPRALWWFRWGAMLTFLTGLIMLGIRGAGLTVDITIGSVMAILMFLNVWLIIWPNQKIVIASNAQIKGGGAALPEAAAAAPKAALASRTNTLFSIPMLYFMGSSAHLPNGMLMSENSTTGLIITLIIIAALELNAIFGKQGVLTSIKGVITSGFVLWAVLLGALILTKPDRVPVAEAPMAEPEAEIAVEPGEQSSVSGPAIGPPVCTGDQDVQDCVTPVPEADAQAMAPLVEPAAETDPPPAAEAGGEAQTEAVAQDIGVEAEDIAVEEDAAGE